jgi:hypothetical protein
VDFLDGDLSCGGMRSLYASWGSLRVPPPNIWVYGDWGYEPTDPCDPYDEIVFEGDLASINVVPGSIYGHVQVDGDLEWLYIDSGGLVGDVYVTGNLADFWILTGSLLGLLEVGSLGPCGYYPHCQIDKDLSGTLHVRATAWLGTLWSSGRS